MDNFRRILIHIYAFVRKEILEILRQPRLILTLVLGPFLILLLFGIGFRNEARVLRTIFVVEAPDSPIIEEIKKYTNLGPQLDFIGIETDRSEAEQQLREGQADLVVIVPLDAYDTIRNNKQALFTLIHNEIDPLQADYIRVFGRVYIDEVNRRILRTLTDNSKAQARTGQERLKAARTHASEMREALEAGDIVTAQTEQQALIREMEALEDSVGGDLSLLDEVEQRLGTQDSDETQSLENSLTKVGENTFDMQVIQQGQEDYKKEIEAITGIEDDLKRLETYLDEFQQISSQVLISPFRSETEAISIRLEVADYFAPAVIVLLLQHLAVTFAALSLVREAQLGTIEVFRVSPISAFETLVGKYISYLIVGLVLGGVLTAILTANIPIDLSGFGIDQRIMLGLGVPMQGLWSSYWLVITALLFASLGVGFLISAIVETDSQAVQYSMIVLLSSVFFSGFFLSIQNLLPAVRTVSWMLPATYAILLLQDIMLRGATGDYLLLARDPYLLAGLLGYGVVLFTIAWLFFRRSMKRE